MSTSVSSNAWLLSQRCAQLGTQVGYCSQKSCTMRKLCTILSCACCTAHSGKRCTQCCRTVCPARGPAGYCPHTAPPLPVPRTPSILSAMHNFECIALHCTEMHTFSILSEQAASILSLLHIMCKTPNSLHILFAHICILKLVQVYTLQYAAGHSFTCRVFCIV